MTRVAAFTLAMSLTGSIAVAQEPAPAVTLLPANPSRWDVAAHVTWLGERRADQAFRWDRWINVASGGGTIGYYWTSHLKMELDVSGSTEDEIYSVEPIALPGTNTLFPLQRDHEFRVTTAAVGVVGQFFDNIWFHPFVSAGLEIVREREHVETTVQGFPPRSFPPAIDTEPETIVRFAARPYIATGFKVYVSERAFIRSDMRTSWSSDGLAALGWHNGIGFDF
ncbi:MAG TPA: hypothetical protein VMS40_03485 [Vicinamibacterales bacterium]|nr:hypothetical protein [Vicinamibacterales bacterium]